MVDSAERFVSVGRILKPHGVRGEVKVAPMTDDLARFKRLGRVFCDMTTGERLTLHVEGTRSAGTDTILLKFKEYATPEAANALRDALIQIPRSESPPLPRGKVYYADMVGLTARRQDTGEALGVVEDILSAGNDLLSIKTPEGAELLIPWVEAFVARIDLEANEVWITPLPGLLEL